jgi:hypothetical protein
MIHDALGHPGISQTLRAVHSNFIGLALRRILFISFHAVNLVNG